MHACHVAGFSFDRIRKDHCFDPVPSGVFSRSFERDGSRRNDMDLVLCEPRIAWLQAVRS